MKKKTLHKWITTLAGPVLTIVVLSFWHYTDNTREELRHLDMKIDTQIGALRQEMSQEIREVRTLLVDYLIKEKT